MPDTDDRDSPSEDEATLWPADVLGEPRYPGEFDVADSPPAWPSLRQVAVTAAAIGAVIGIGVGLVLPAEWLPARGYPPVTPTITVAPVTTSAAAATAPTSPPVTGGHRYCVDTGPDQTPGGRPGHDAGTPGADRSPNIPGVDAPTWSCGVRR